MKANSLDYSLFKEALLSGRYITNTHIEGCLKKVALSNFVKVEGSSFEGRDIYGLQLGTGPRKVLIWSQMHGNESTTTKGIFDFLNFLLSDEEDAKNILDHITIRLLPILNPDGALRYSRFNANGIDLNRDAQDLSQPESRLIRTVYNTFRPDYCFNMHDQRTIFSAGKNKKPATLSFLTPAFNPSCDLNDSRIRSMQLIASISKEISTRIPGQIGRYDDAYNPNCLGDTFQGKGTPTLLFEAGHYTGDYQREKTRELIFHSLYKGLKSLTDTCGSEFTVEDYFGIPENKKLFFDYIIKNASAISNNPNRDIGILYKEVLSGNKIIFKPTVEKQGVLDGFYGHVEYDCSVERDLENLKKNVDLYKAVF